MLKHVLRLVALGAAVLMVACEEAATPTSTASAPAQPSAQPSAPAPNPPAAPSAPTNPPAAPETPGAGGGGGFPVSPGGTVPAGTVVSNIVFELLPDGAPAGSLSRSESKIALPALDGYRTESIALTGSVITSRFPAGFAYTWEDSRKRHLWKRDQDAPAITSAWLANGGTVVVSYSLDGNQTWHDRLDGQGTYFHAVHSWGRADGAAEGEPGFVRLRLYRESSNADHPVIGNLLPPSFSLPPITYYARHHGASYANWPHNCKTTTTAEYSSQYQSNSPYVKVDGSGGLGLPIAIRNSVNGPVAATAEAVLFNGQIIRVKNLNPATYTSASPVVTFPGIHSTWPTANQESQPGSGATFGAVSSEKDKIAKVVVVRGGSKYHVDTTVTFPAPSSGTRATGTVTITDGVVTAITVTNKGSGYTSPIVSRDPLWPSSGADGVYLSWMPRAAGTVTVASGAVTGVTITDGGSGYTRPPGVRIYGLWEDGSCCFGTGATATATITSGAVTGVTITSGGSFYRSAVVVFSNPGIATGTATINASGKVTGVTITDGGSGYTSAPGVGFQHPGSSGIEAFGTATINASGAVTGVTITRGGSGYTSAPRVTFGAQGPETNAYLVATLGSAIDVTAGGSGYRQVCSGISALTSPFSRPGGYFIPADHADTIVAGFWPTAVVKESIRSIAETSNNSILVRFAIISPSSTQPPVPVGS